GSSGNKGGGGVMSTGDKVNDPVIIQDPPSRRADFEEYFHSLSVAQTLALIGACRICVPGHFPVFPDEPEERVPLEGAPGEAAPGGQ
ncbi:MAG: hypothetical protein V5B39_21470, partial [Accumulibacter sp.]|uniref:hypothetical protein n=1 Tax=Accumulibacter sp. TaxID=2053492 RepID=UPI002FC2CCD0